MRRRLVRTALAEEAIAEGVIGVAASLEQLEDRQRGRDPHSQAALQVEGEIGRFVPRAVPDGQLAEPPFGVGLRLGDEVTASH